MSEAPAPAAQLGRYRAVGAGVVRTGVELDSPKAKPSRLELGQEFEGLQRETLTHTLEAHQTCPLRPLSLPLPLSACISAWLSLCCCDG